MYQTIILCSASVLVLMHAILGFHVSKKRLALSEAGSGQERENDLKKAIRAHGNASEYNAIFIAIFLYFSVAEPNLLTAVLCVLTAGCRVAHAVGMLSVKTAGDRHPLRFVGALGTYISLVVLAIVLVF
jgi:uncharacterized protein